MNEKNLKTSETTELHGGNIYKIFRERNVTEILDYSSNINPYGMPESLKEAIIQNLNIIERYPDPDYIDLRKKIAFHNKIDMKNVILGNGATEIIFLFIKVLKPKRVLIVSPTFGEYERAVKASLNENRTVQTDYFELEEKDNFEINIEKLKKKLEKKYDLLVICNPNNPTGKFLKLRKMEEILKECNKYEIKLLVDEAFIEFLEKGLDESIVNSIENKKNLFVIRAFTKFFAIPGLRLGYGIYFDDSLTSRLEKKKEPWSVNNFAELGGITVLDDKKYIEKTLNWIMTEKKYMYESLSEIKGIKPYETHVNFILLKIKEELMLKGVNVKVLKERMIEKGILIRDASNFTYLDESYFRLAIKDRESNDRVLKALGEVIEENIGK